MWFWFLLALPEQYSRPNEPVSWTKEEKSGTHQLNLTTFPVANSTANDDAPSWHAFSSVTSFLFVAVFWRLRGRSNGDVNPSDSQAKRSHTSVSHVFLWMDIEGIFPFYSIGFFPRAFTLRAMMFAWNWHRNRRHPNFVPSKRRSAWNFRNELYNFFFSLSSFAAATSPSLSTTTVTIKQKIVSYKKKISFRDRISNKVLGWLRVKSTGKGCRRCFWCRLHSLVVLSPLSWKYNNNKKGEKKKKVEDPTQKETRTRHTKGYTKV